MVPAVAPLIGDPLRRGKKIVRSDRDLGRVRARTAPWCPGTKSLYFRGRSFCRSKMPNNQFGISGIVETVGLRHS
jgi:hypothetical protein